MKIAKLEWFVNVWLLSHTDKSTGCLDLEGIKRSLDQLHQSSERCPDSDPPINKEDYEYLVIFVDHWMVNYAQNGRICSGLNNFQNDTHHVIDSIKAGTFTKSGNRPIDKWLVASMIDH